MLCISLDIRHKSFHALFKHSSVSQGHGLEFWQKVRCVSLELHLLQGALHTPHSYLPWLASHPRGSPITAKKTKSKTIPFHLLRSEAQFQPKYFTCSKKYVKFKRKLKNLISHDNPNLVAKYSNTGSLFTSLS